MRKFLAALALSAAALGAAAQDTFQACQTEQVASYQIDASLDADAKMVSGTEILTWKNTTQDTVPELMFHTYLNAFKNSKSTYFAESQMNTGYNLAGGMSECEMGYIDILRMAIVDGEPLTQDLKYVQPDDMNADDQTVMKVKLPQPVLPGQEIKISISFLSKLPRIVSRTGYERGDFYMVGQWFPKIGVYEPKGMRQRKAGGWNCHQFHYNSEFYADFGTYDVSITVPEDFKVGATGLETYNALSDNGTRTVKFHAADVIDFAWTASPRYEVATTTYNSKTVKLMYMPEHSGQVDRLLQAAKNAIEYMQSNVGEYPYPQVTIADCPYYAGNAAGMEYPMFFTVTTFKHIPSGVRQPEEYVVHEFIHNYFMATVATNEFEEAWLDEGFTSFYEAEVMDYYYGEGSLVNFMGIKINSSEKHRLSYTQSYNPAIAQIENFVWKYPTYTYGMLAYSKACTMMQTLKGLMGDDHFRQAMMAYFEKYKFKHPSGRDFIAVINQEAATMDNPSAGENLNWFFESMLRTDQVCDYKLTKIVNRSGQESAHGFFDNGLSKLFLNDSQPSEVRSSVFVQRMGTMVMPVELLVTFEDGSSQTLWWDGHGRCKEFVVSGPSPVAMAQIDPGRKIACDIDYLNNSVQAASSASPIWKYAAKFLFWLENIFQTVAFFA